jgi:hypothetical protein
MISDRNGFLKVKKRADAGRPYQLGLRITDFHVCAHCGVYVAATWSDGEMNLGVLNIRVLEEKHRFAKTITEVDFAGEDLEARQRRRRAHWMPTTVTLIE